MAQDNLRDRIYREYLGRIRRGEIERETRLVDTAIAAQHGVSRMPVREALLRLTHEGYLVSTTRGFMLPQLSHDEILEIFELRRLLEPRAAARATPALTEAALERMRRAVADTHSTISSNDIMLFYNASEAFREAWLSAVPNTELRRSIQRFLGHVQAVRLATMRDPEAHKIIVLGQTRLLAAFEERDAVAVGDEMLDFVVAAAASYCKQRVETDLPRLQVD